MNTLRVNSCSISTKKLFFKLMNLSFKGTLFQVQTQGCEERERERERERNSLYRITVNPIFTPEYIGRNKWSYLQNCLENLKSTPGNHICGTAMKQK